jgi:hypothetical protein
MEFKLFYPKSSYQYIYLGAVCINGGISKEPL